MRRCRMLTSWVTVRSPRMLFTTVVGSSVPTRAARQVGAPAEARSCSRRLISARHGVYSTIAVEYVSAVSCTIQRHRSYSLAVCHTPHHMSCAAGHACCAAVSNQDHVMMCGARSATAEGW